MRQFFWAFAIVALSVTNAWGQDEQAVLTQCLEWCRVNQTTPDCLHVEYEMREGTADSVEAALRGEITTTKGPQRVAYKFDGVTEWCRITEPGETHGTVVTRRGDVQLRVVGDKNVYEVIHTREGLQTFDGNFIQYNNHIHTIENILRNLSYVDRLRFEGESDFHGRKVYSIFERNRRLLFEPEKGMALYATEQVPTTDANSQRISMNFLLDWKELEPTGSYPMRQLRVFGDEKTLGMRVSEKSYRHVSVNPFLNQEELSFTAPVGATLWIDDKSQVLTSPRTIYFDEGPKLLFRKHWYDTLRSLFRDREEFSTMLQQYPEVRVSMVKWGMGTGLVLAVVVAGTVQWWWRRRQAAKALQRLISHN